MFTLIGSTSICLIALVVCVLGFMFDAPVLGMICIPFVLVFGIAAFVQWADMSNV
jgi:hypothetical protein